MNEQALDPERGPAKNDSETSGPPAYDASLADHGFDAKAFRGLVYPLGDFAPEYGRLFQIAPGIGWTRLPVPGALNHINIWLLDDEDAQGKGVAIVDTGLFIPPSIEAWKTLFAGDLAGRRITRVICTHFHPDHIGGAGWLCNKFKVQLWMNRTEWLMARVFTADQRDEPPREALAQMRHAGWSEERLTKMREGGWGSFARVVSDVPVSHHRLISGSSIAVGQCNWSIMTGGGHTPEHVSLIDNAAKVMISGDQILPRITSNVSLMITEPHADPLREWLDGIAQFRAELSGDELVLPAHGFPFTGVHERLDTLAKGHHQQLAMLEDAIRDKPLRAVDCFSVLFKRQIDDSVYGIATGEAMAHLRYLERDDRAICKIIDGVGWYSAN